MLIYLANYPRCGSGVLRWLIRLNFHYGCDSHWDVAPGDRAALAADSALHFVKTHRPPHADYLPGERAVQMVRHPAAALASHFRLFHAANPGKSRPLKRFIAGQRQNGDWSSYHRAWADAPVPFLRLHYEEATREPEAAVRALADFLGLPMPATIAAETAEQAHARNPMRNPNAPPDAWRELFVGKDLTRLLAAHGPLMSELGYVVEADSVAGQPKS